MAGERAYTTVSVDFNPFDEDQNTDALISGYLWDTSVSNVITYSFPNAESDISYSLAYEGVGWGSGLSFVEREAARKALQLWDDVAAFELQETSNDAEGTIRLFKVTGIDTAFGFYPWSDEEAGDSVYAASNNEIPDVGTWTFKTYIHEIGHNLGLEHGHEGDGLAGEMTPEFDGMEYSTMTYTSHVGQDPDPGFYTNSYGSFAQTPMIYDIAAIQRLYGADYGTNNGDTVYTFNGLTGEMQIDGVGQGRPEENVVFRTIWDGGGIDTYDLSNFNTDLVLDLRQGEASDFDVGGNQLRALLDEGWDDFGFWGGSRYEVWSDYHLYNALMFEGDVRSLIENAIGGAGDDLLRGNGADNELSGGSGRDRLIGLDGDDTLDGGAGTDEAVFFDDYAAFDVLINEAGLKVVGHGWDTVTDTVENLVFDDQTYSYQALANAATYSAGDLQSTKDAMVAILEAASGGGAGAQGSAPTEVNDTTLSNVMSDTLDDVFLF